MWMSLLTNKNTYIVIIILGLIAYYNVKILGLKVSYNDKVVEFNDLFKEFTSAEDRVDDLEDVIDDIEQTNKDNIVEIEKYRVSAENLGKQYQIVIDGKSSEIRILKNTISKLRNLPKPNFDNAEVKVQKCVVYITEGDTNETKASLIDFTSIGK